DSVIGSRLRG
ncbi:hypothetical protein EC82524_3662B, partial [Escherichia coli 8.2524]